jgi:hypothetical protein
VRPGGFRFGGAKPVCLYFDRNKTPMEAAALMRGNFAFVSEVWIGGILAFLGA